VPTQRILDGTYKLLQASKCGTRQVTGLTQVTNGTDQSEVGDGHGKAKWVQIDVDAAARDVDHMIGAEERFQFAMTRQ
jgi:hypothetical protein